MAASRASTQAETFDGRKLRRYREARGSTQRSLGTAVGASQSTVSKIERGVFAPSTELQEALAHALDADLSELLSANTVASHRVAAANPRPHSPVRRADDDDPRVKRMLANLRRGRRNTPPVLVAPTYFKCPYCDGTSYTETEAVKHAVACDKESPGYSEVRVRYVDLRAI